MRKRPFQDGLVKSHLPSVTINHFSGSLYTHREGSYKVCTLIPLLTDIIALPFQGWPELDDFLREPALLNMCNGHMQQL